MNRLGTALLIFVFAFPLSAFSQWYVGATAGQYDLSVILEALNCSQ